MRHNISASLIRLSILAVAFWCGVLTASAQTTAFSYQGQLNDGGGPANGSYDLQFKLFDALTAGTQVGSTATLTNVTVTNGVFTVTLDFGASAFPGANRWLEISVRLAGAGSFTTLTPRQQLTSTPYAIKSLSTATADGLSAACVGCVSGSQIGSLPASSGNYIQNTTTQQTSSNFNISGNGLIGGNVGIGTPIPQSKLHVLDSTSNFQFYNLPGLAVASVVNTAPNSLAVLNLQNNSRAWQFRVDGSNANKFSIFDATAIAHRLIIDTNGNVGIGGNPLTKLDIQGSDSSFNGVALRLFNSNAGNTNQWVLGTGGATVAEDAFSIGDSTFYRMTILSNGNVGIGTTTPNSKLTVVSHDIVPAISAYNDGLDPGGFTYAPGIRGESVNSTGVEGVGITGVYGSSSSSFGAGVNGYTTGAGAYGVLGQATGNNGNGVYGVANFGPHAYGVWGVSSSGFAGKFNGNVNITGTLSNSRASFKIDHPLDPENKYLYHSSVESPDMMNIYNGNVTTNAEGEATVTMPNYLEALNRDFRYQLTVIGQFAQAIVSSKINGNSFTIRTDKPNVEVSWQVTGIRQDAYARKNRIPVEEEKPEAERGSYLHPEVFDKPEELGVEWKLRPVMMKAMKEQREKSQQSNQSQQR